MYTIGLKGALPLEPHPRREAGVRSLDAAHLLSPHQQDVIKTLSRPGKCPAGSLDKSKRNACFYGITLPEFDGSFCGRNGMAVKKANLWQGIEMLPVVDEMISDEINDAHAQLSWLSSTVSANDDMTNDHSQQLIDRYEEKSTQADKLKEQCRLWRNTQHLSDQQKDMLTSLEGNLVRMEKVAQQVLMQIKKIMN